MTLLFTCDCRNWLKKNCSCNSEDPQLFFRQLSVLEPGDCWIEIMTLRHGLQLSLTFQKKNGLESTASPLGSHLLRCPFFIGSRRKCNPDAVQNKLRAHSHFKLWTQAEGKKNHWKNLTVWHAWHEPNLRWALSGLYGSSTISRPSPRVRLAPCAVTLRQEQMTCGTKQMKFNFSFMFQLYHWSTVHMKLNPRWQTTVHSNLTHWRCKMTNTGLGPNTCPSKTEMKCEIKHQMLKMSEDALLQFTIAYKLRDLGPSEPVTPLSISQLVFRQVTWNWHETSMTEYKLKVSLLRNTWNTYTGGSFPPAAPVQNSWLLSCHTSEQWHHRHPDHSNRSLKCDSNH